MTTAFRLTAIDEMVMASIARLLPQLSTARVPSLPEMQALIANPDTHLLGARDPGLPGTIAGLATLTIYRIPTGVQARIDDVVVDSAVRGRGIGEVLTLAAIAIAREANARSVSLTSRPDREAANRLYQRLGFELLATNAYRLRLA